MAGWVLRTANAVREKRFLKCHRGVSVPLDFFFFFKAKIHAFYIRLHCQSTISRMSRRYFTRTAAVVRRRRVTLARSGLLEYTYSRIGLLRSYGNLQSYWTTTKLWKLTVVLNYYAAVKTYSRIGLLRSSENLKSYWSTTKLLKLTVVLEYYEAVETYSRIGVLRSYVNLQSYWTTTKPYVLGFDSIPISILFWIK